MLKNKIIFLILILLANISYAEKPKIVTSTIPVAIITKMIAGDLFNINIIQTSKGCPHHYQMRPSDRNKAKNANVLIYIDDHFDNFASLLFSKSKNLVVRISDMKSLDFLGSNGQKNYHFWLSLENILAFQDELSDILIKSFPEFEANILSNKDYAKSQISKLAENKNQILEGLGELVLLSDSLEHLFDKGQSKVIKLYQKENSSLSNFKELDSILNNDLPRCIVIDSSQNPAGYKRFNKPIIQLNSENWSEKNDFITEYLSLLSQFKKCNK